MHSNKIKTIALGFFVAMQGSSNFLVADEATIPNGITISPMFGHYAFNTEVDVESDNFYSFGLGYQFDSPWAIELVYLQVESEAQAGNDNVDVDQIRLDALYGFERNQHLQPYLAFGIGERESATSFLKKDETVVNFGGGLKYFVTTKLSLRGDVRMINSVDEENTDLAYSVGLQYTFGKSRSKQSGLALQEATSITTSAEYQSENANAINTDADDDNDGVVNSLDQCPNSEAGANIDTMDCSVITQSHSIKLDIKFANNSSSILQDNFDEIEKVAQFMNQYHQAKVVVEGHTDDSGDTLYNLTLSEQRANAVAELLIVKYGIDSARVTAKGLGESSPLVDASTENYRTINRRVVAVLNVVEDIKK